MRERGRQSVRGGGRPRPGPQWRALPALAALSVAALWTGPAPAGGGEAAADSAAAPGWPLRHATRYLTANFMEPRPGRFHAGIDLKTDGACGLPVLAVEDGWISALRALPDGYGRTLVLEGRSGRQYLYAHLERFADRWRPLLEAAQQAAGCYRVELAPGPGQLPVARGEVLALSGQSGTLGPHLHFEVRQSGGLALNPLRHGFAVADTIPPLLLKLRAQPAAPGARVAGGLQARSVSSPAGLSGRLPLLAVTGPIAFSAEIVERSDRHGHRLAPHEVKVRLDGSEVFSARNDTLPLALQQQRLLEAFELGGAQEMWLHLRPGNRLAGRQGQAWSLAQGGLSPGLRQVELQIADAAGNRTVVSWELAVAMPWVEAAADSAGAGGWRRDPAVAGPEGMLTPFLELRQAPDGGVSALALRRPGEQAPPAAPWRRLLLAPETSPAVWETLAIYLRPDTLGAAQQRALAAQGLAPAGPALVAAAGDWPAPGRVELPWPIAGAAELAAVWPGAADVGLYQQSGGGRWRWRACLAEGLSPPDSAGGWRVRLAGPGRYAVLRDELPPRLGGGPAEGRVRPRRPRALAGVTLPRWETVAVAAADGGAGVDPGSARAWLDGRPLVPEPDLVRGRLLIDLPDSAGPGRHVLRLQIADRAGRVVDRTLPLHLVAGD